MAHTTPGCVSCGMTNGKRASFKSDGDDYEEGVGENRCVVSSAGCSQCRLPAGHSGFCRDGRGVWGGAAVEKRSANEKEVDAWGDVTAELRGRLFNALPVAPSPTVRAWKCGCGAEWSCSREVAAVEKFYCFACRSCVPMAVVAPASLDLVPRAEHIREADATYREYMPLEKVKALVAGLEAECQRYADLVGAEVSAEALPTQQCVCEQCGRTRAVKMDRAAICYGPGHPPRYMRPVYRAALLDFLAATELP